MTIDSPLFPLSVPFFGALLSCSSVNPHYCDEHTPCDNDQRCDLSSNSCATPPVQQNIQTCSDGHLCAPSIPEGWLGPLVHARAAADTTLPTCTDEYSIEVATLHSELSSSGHCECECGQVADIKCSLPISSIGYNSLDGCATPDASGVGLPVDCVLRTPPCPKGKRILTSFTPILPAQRSEIVGFSSSLVEDGTCSPPTLTGDSNQFDSRFNSTLRLCRAPASITKRCEGGSHCALPTPPQFENSQCVARPGEQECPAGSSYSERTLMYSDVVDLRSCDASECTCETNGICEGTVILHPAATSIYRRSPAPGCMLFGPEVASYQWIPSPIQDCQQGGQSQVTGELMMSGAMTLCCTKAEATSRDAVNAEYDTFYREES